MLISFFREEMNEAAWEASKAQLIPCDNCGRRCLLIFKVLNVYT